MDRYGRQKPINARGREQSVSNIGTGNQVHDHGHECDEMQSLVSSCHSMGGFGNCWQMESACCNCVATGYGYFSGTGWYTDSWSDYGDWSLPIMNEYSDTAGNWWDMLVAGSGTGIGTDNWQWNTECNCWFTCQQDLFEMCTGSGPTIGGQDIGAGGGGRGGWRKGGRIKRRRRR